VFLVFFIRVIHLCITIVDCVADDLRIRESLFFFLSSVSFAATLNLLPPFLSAATFDTTFVHPLLCDAMPHGCAHPHARVALTRMYVYVLRSPVCRLGTDMTKHVQHVTDITAALESKKESKTRYAPAWFTLFFSFESTPIRTHAHSCPSFAFSRPSQQHMSSVDRPSS
jgi:hypothetical protein